MKHRGLLAGGRGREKECAKLVIIANPSKRGRPPKGLLVFVNGIPTSTSNTPLKRSKRTKKKRCFIYVVEVLFLRNMQPKFLVLFLI